MMNDIHTSILISPETVFIGEFNLSHHTTIGYSYGRPGKTTIIGKNIKIGSFVTIEDDVEIGNDVLIDHCCTIYSGTRIGNNSRIIYGAKIYSNAIVGSNCIVGGDLVDRMILENDVTFLGSVAHSYRNALLDWDESDESSPIIKNGAVVGVNALLIGGISIGVNCYVAAGEILRHDLPDNSVFLKGKILPITHFRGLIKSRYNEKK